jgi:hypothetical protein
MSGEITGDRLDRILVDLGAAGRLTSEEAKALIIGLAWLESTMKSNPGARAMVEAQGVTMEGVSKLLRT